MDTGCDDDVAFANLFEGMVFGDRQQLYIISRYGFA
jgi:hypothetical protein